MARRVLVVGASIAGYSVARALIEGGFDGKVTLLGAEPTGPYERPALSKQVLTSGGGLDRMWTTGAAELEGLGIEFLPGVAATELDPARRVVRDEHDGEHHYDDLVIATGSQPRRLPVAQITGMHYLRSLQDALALKESLQTARQVVVVGGGFVGAEVASSARMLGRPVTMLEMAPRLFARSADLGLSDRMLALHRDRGVDVRTGIRVVEVHGTERVEALELSNGQRILCDVCVIGVGIQPATDWLRTSGIVLRDGVLCGPDGATSSAGVWAAGDVARIVTTEGDQGHRSEHWTAARTQGLAVAHNILTPGDPRPLATVPYAWSDQHGIKIQLVGDVSGTGRSEREDIDPTSGRFMTTYYAGGLPVGGVGFGATGRVAKLRRVLETRSSGR